MLEEEKLFNRNYLFLFAANFMFFFSFYMLLPILPFFIKQNFDVGNSVVGAVISCYSIATLCVRPFSGYLMDSFNRKPLYIISLSLVSLMFCGYFFAATITLLVVVRIMHGLAFGCASVGGNTLVIDVVPSARRGEGVGYFGVSSNVAMAVGPMVSLLLMEQYGFDTVFVVCFVFCVVAVLLATQVHTKYRPPVKRPPLSFDRFILTKGLLAGGSFVLLAFAYGHISNYIAIYAKEMGLGISSGLFFTVFAAGMICSRLFSGRMVDKGLVTQTITLGLSIVLLAMFGLSMCEKVNAWNPAFANYYFLIVALCGGLGFGTSFPAFNNLFINLAPNSQRGTATSTYLTSWDVGIGLGIFLGGVVSEYSSFSTAYLVADICVLAALIFFVAVVAPHYQKNKLR